MGLEYVKEMGLEKERVKLYTDSNVFYLILSPFFIYIINSTELEEFDFYKLVVVSIIIDFYFILCLYFSPYYNFSYFLRQIA